MRTMKSASASKAKIVSITDAVRYANKARAAGKRIVTTNGCFDLLHVGHAMCFEFAKAQGDLLIVGVNTDAWIRKYKKREPVVPARERAYMIAALGSVDYVFTFGHETPHAWLVLLKPHVHVKGSDRAIAGRRLIESDAVEAHGGRVVFFPHTGKHSTTAMIQRAKKLH